MGWPLFNTIYKKGFNVTGLDINEELIKSYKNKNKNFKLYHNYQDINFDKIDIIIIALPTPLKNKVPDLSYLKITMNLLYPKLKKNMLIILESTSYPTTTDQVISSKISKKFQIGKNFFVGYSPEREDRVIRILTLKIYQKSYLEKQIIVKNL